MRRDWKPASSRTALATVARIHNGASSWATSAQRTSSRTVPVACRPSCGCEDVRISRPAGIAASSFVSAASVGPSRSAARIASCFVTASPQALTSMPSLAEKLFTTTRRLPEPSKGKSEGDRLVSTKRAGTDCPRALRSERRLAVCAGSSRRTSRPSARTSRWAAWASRISFAAACQSARPAILRTITRGSSPEPARHPDESAMSSVSRRTKENGSAGSAGSLTDEAAPRAAKPSARLTISLQTGISCHGSSVSETRTVSPKPSARSEPMPMADLMRASSPSPASVTPRCSG